MAREEGGLCSVFVEGDDIDDATDNIEGDGLREDDVDEDPPRRRRDVE